MASEAPAQGRPTFEELLLMIRGVNTAYRRLSYDHPTVNVATVYTAEEWLERSYTLDKILRYLNKEYELLATFLSRDQRDILRDDLQQCRIWKSDTSQRRIISLQTHHQKETQDRIQVQEVYPQPR